MSFDIGGLENLRQFKREIGFSSPQKNEDLDIIIKSFEIDPVKFTKKLIVDNLKQTALSKTSKQLAKEIGKAYSTVRKYLKNFMRRAKLKLQK